MFLIPRFSATARLCKHRLRVVATLSLLTVVAGLSTVSARDGELTIRITEGIESALPIAVVPFATENGEGLSFDLAAIVRSDLSRSGRFAAMPPEDLPSRPSTFSARNFTTSVTLFTKNC